MERWNLFKNVWRGWFVGTSILMIPTLLLAALFLPDILTWAALGVFVIPVIAALQGIMVGGLVVLGVTIWPTTQGER